MEVAPVELEAIVPDALVVLATEIELTGTQLELGPLPVVRGDARQLQLVFSNLVGNAIKYRQGGSLPKIRIDAERHGDDWCVSVRDNGIGIDAGRADAMFAMFARERPDGDRPGFGIGLALCKRIVERHGGRIWVEPTDAGGTVVSFTLPAA